MTSNITDELRSLATSVLERRGAIVEWSSPANDGMAIVDASTAAILDLPDDTLRISTTAPPDRGRWQLSLASDLLESLARLLDAEPRVARLRLPEGYLKTQGLPEAVAKTFTWLNAKVRVGDSESRTIEYHTWWFRASLSSEDRWETSFPLTVNSVSGCELELPNTLDCWEIEPQLDPATEWSDAAVSFNRACQLAESHTVAAAADFLTRMDSRFRRDRQRLKEYYGALLRESDRPSSRRPDAADPERAEAKRRAVQLELRRKLDELAERYSMRGTLEPVAVVRTALTVRAIWLDVFRKQARREHQVFWNPLLKHVEPLPCRQCVRPTYTVGFTNDHVEPVCATCLAEH